MSRQESTQSGPGGQHRVPRLLKQVGEIFGRSLFPVLALVVILGTPLWGAWVSLALAVACWSVIMRFA